MITAACTLMHQRAIKAVKQALQARGLKVTVQVALRLSHDLKPIKITLAPNFHLPIACKRRML